MFLGRYVRQQRSEMYALTVRELHEWAEATREILEEEKKAHENTDFD